MEKCKNYSLLVLVSPSLIIIETMAKKIALNLYVDPDMAARLRETAAHYDNRLGDCLSAAIFLFLSATPREQADALQKVYAAALTNSVKSLLDEMRVQQTTRALATAEAEVPQPPRPATPANEQKPKLPGLNKSRRSER